MTDTALMSFVRESNRIEGIMREPHSHELMALERFLALDTVTIADLQVFVTVTQPGAVLRDQPHLNVQVGNHVAPRGGMHVVGSLGNLLSSERGDINPRLQDRDPFETHRAYERLHPFTDGNGRSGRALWLWMMCNRGGRDKERALRLGFLHSWYYQSLDAS